MPPHRSRTAKVGSEHGERIGLDRHRSLILSNRQSRGEREAKGVRADRRRKTIVYPTGLISPAPKTGAYRVTGPHGGEEHDVALLEQSLLDGVAGGQRDGPGGGVAVAFDVDQDLLPRYTQTLGSGVDDANVGLVRNHHGHVVEGEAVALQQGGANLEHFPDGVLENLLALLMDVVQASVDGFVARRHTAAAGGHFEEVAARAIDLAQEIDVTIIAVAILGWFQQ